MLTTMGNDRMIAKNSGFISNHGGLSARVDGYAVMRLATGNHLLADGYSGRWRVAYFLCGICMLEWNLQLAITRQRLIAWCDACQTLVDVDAWCAVRIKMVGIPAKGWIPVVHSPDYLATRFSYARGQAKTSEREKALQEELKQVLKLEKSVGYGHYRSFTGLVDGEHRGFNQPLSRGFPQVQCPFLGDHGV